MKRIMFAQHKMLTQDSEVFKGQQTENVKHIACIHSLGNFSDTEKTTIVVNIPSFKKNIF